MFITEPPSVQLPPVRSLATQSPDALIDCIEYLRVLYSPGIRGSKIRRRFRANSSSQSPIPSVAHAAPFVPIPNPRSNTAAAALRSDEFERAYTIRWLTYLINNVENLRGSPSEVDSVVGRAASLLANCGGTSSAGTITRTFEFQSERGPIKRDIASVGAQTWGGACVLSEIIAAQPADFGLVTDPLSPPLRVLELGAGTGLVGLVLATVAKSIGVDSVTVVSTDFYPSVLDNLASNISTAFSTPNRSISISSHFLDWSTFSKNNIELPPPVDTPFDVILGADVVYEPEHAPWIHACVSRLLAPGSSSQFHLVVPLRRTHTFESNSVELAFQASAKEPVLTILSRETIVCDAEESATEEVEYLYYRIGWNR
ncbi:putative methyltransferase-domain-containing protein [Mycena galopus ATCC 62051]|nr:putative methyltransferase-domain-containing protein [Mycena galopus ATCC 62051]